ncbi:MAG: thermostable hemolysin [Candidatus Brevundimonas phytovorans]|nr:thermostable hemolysin [Brevundimonas sp.]WEK58389.1 MAG: thermostable hemolysin [Brevundimonas sp.]
MFPVRLSSDNAAPPGRPRRTLSARITRFDDPSRDERRRVERFIEAAYAEAYGSRILTHYPTLMSVQDETGALYAAVGFRCAAEDSLFLEHYLEAPVETVLGQAIGAAVPRAEVVEIGSLASSGQGATVFLFAALARHLQHEGRTFAVAVATSELRRIFHKAGLGTLQIARADPDRLADGGGSWGAYYQTDPIVLAGSIKAATAPLHDFAEQAPVGRAVRTRLHYEDRS